MPQTLASVLLIGLSLYICAIDIRSHRIPNASILGMTIVLIYPNHSLDLPSASFSLLLIWTFGIFSNLGMGDLKLLTVLLLLQGEILLRPITLSIGALVITFMIAIHLIVNKSLKGDIALAPAILIPFTMAYLTN
jgi:Flp pilus assembly protein protease CpaA